MKSSNASSGRVLAAAITLLFACSVSVSAAENSDCRGSRSSPIEIALPRDGEEIVTRTSPSVSWMVIEEIGQTVEIAVDTPAPRIQVKLPPRYGTIFVNVMAAPVVRIRRAEFNHASTKVRVTKLCADDPAWPAMRTWWEAVAAVTDETDKPLSSSDAGALANRVADLSARAPDARGGALVLHLSAQIKLVSQQFGKAATAFAAAEQAWLAVDDPARAAAARVGRAESMVASGDYEAVLDLVPAPRDRQRRTYYEVRLLNSRCIAFHYLHRLQQAGACYRWLAQQLQRLDEHMEYVNALRNSADLQFALGDPDRAIETARRAFELAVGPNASMVRGRAKLTSANISLARGDVQAAIADTNIALENFVEARAPSWQGDALLKAAAIYSELGARDESYLSVRDAFGRYSKDEPALVAGALGVYAGIEHDNHRFAEALYAEEAAVRIFSTLKMPEELERARLAKWRVQLDIGDWRDVERSLANNAAVSPMNAAARALLEADIAIRQKDYGFARARLYALRRGPMGFSQAMDAARLEAELWRAQGDGLRADAVLDAAMQSIDVIAHSTDNTLLRLMLARQARVLRASALNALLEQPPGSDTILTDKRFRIEAAWHWFARAPGIDELRVTNRPPQGIRTATRLDRAIAAELLAVPPSTSAGEVPFAERHELLSLLAGRRDETLAWTKASDVPALSAVQARLDQGEGLLAYLDGAERSALLYVTRSTADLYPVGAAQDVKATVNELRILTRSPSKSLVEVAATAARLSQELFAGMPAAPLPDKLNVVAGGPLEGTPWSILTWSGKANVLLDTTMVRQVRLTREGVVNNDTGHRIELHVVVPDRRQRELSHLPRLSLAEAEPEMIRDAIRDLNIVTDAEVHATPTDVLFVLNRPRAWVHVAAHGTAQPSRIGYAGLWLDPEQPDSTPQFLSWIDILDRGISADLVVLNACQLGDSGDAINGNLSFASATSQAGAKQVVASLWPVSDAASAIWVPAFYSALTADPKHDAAEALRAAQLKLRESRAFRHPFYWAGMQAFTHLPILPAPTAASKKQSAKSKAARSAPLISSSPKASPATAVRLH